MYTPTALSTPLPVLSLSTAGSIGFTAAQFSTCGAAGIPFPIAPQSLPMMVPPVRFKFDSTVNRACSLTVALFSTCGAPDGTRFATVSPCHHNIGECSIVRSRPARANTIILTPPPAHSTKLFRLAWHSRPPFHVPLPCPVHRTSSAFFVATTSSRPTRAVCLATTLISLSTLMAMKLRNRRPS